MKKLFVLLMSVLFLVPSVSSASTFTQVQVDAIIGLLQAFNVDAATLSAVKAQLAIKDPAPILILTPAPAPSAPLPIQIITGSTMPTENLAAVTTEIVHVAPADPVNDLPHGSYTVRVRVLDEKGITVNGATVVMSVDGGTITKKIDTRETPKSKDFYTSFLYTPASTGTKSLVFTSGDLTSTLQIVVE